MTTGLERIAAKARTDRQRQFTSLAHHITTEMLWEELKVQRNSRAPGIDGESVQEAKASFVDWAQVTIDAVHRRGYRPPAIKRVYIPKPGKDEKRPLGIPTVADAALQRAAARILSAIFEQDFLPNSFGGRENRNAHMAVASMLTAIRERGCNFVFEADIKNFFGTLDHGWLGKFIGHRIGDQRILTLVRRWLKAGILEDGATRYPEYGTPQGGPISVVLSNIYLHFVLDLWIEKVVKPRLKGEMYYFRYLDDFLVCFQNREDAERFATVLPNRLARFSLTLEPNKTGLTEFGRSAVTKAEKSGGKVKTIYFVGFTFYCCRNGKGKVKIVAKTEKTRSHRSLQKVKDLVKEIRHQPLKKQKQQINQLLGGLFRYYGIIGNSRFLAKIQHVATIYWRRALSSRSQKGRVTWEKFNKILQHYPLQKPKIVMGYRDIPRYSVL